MSVPLLMSTLAIRGMFTFDRYWIEHLASLEVLGAYVLFVSVSSALVSFLDAGVFVFIYPSLIAAHNSSNSGAFREAMLKLTIQTLSIGLLFGACAMIFMPHLLNFLGKPDYVNQEWIFPWTVIATLIFCLGMVPQYGLYAQNKDRPIIASHVFGFATFLSVVYLFSEKLNEVSVLLGLCIGVSVSSIWKSYAYLKQTPRSYILKLKSE
ncbi:hypothetical protein D3C77_450730 [compost metagenome]